MQISFNDNLLNENLGLSWCAGGDYRGQEAHEGKKKSEGRKGGRNDEAINLNLCNLSASSVRISKLSTTVIKLLVCVLLDGGMWCRYIPLSLISFWPTHPKCVQTHSHFSVFRKHFSSAICSILFPPKYKTPSDTRRSHDRKSKRGWERGGRRASS